MSNNNSNNQVEMSVERVVDRRLSEEMWKGVDRQAVQQKVKLATVCGECKKRATSGPCTCADCRMDVIEKRPRRTCSNARYKKCDACKTMCCQRCTVLVDSYSYDYLCASCHREKTRF